MNKTAAQLPEYPVVMAMHGIGPTLGPQLMAEIFDVSRFSHKGALTAFAGVDPGANQSGTHEQKASALQNAVQPSFARPYFRS